MLIRFEYPADTRRPGKSHRFDVFGLKIKRSLILFGRDAVETWIGLERDLGVTWYCERPMLINDPPFKRLADFYTIRHGKEQLLFILPKGQKQETFVQKELGPGFAEWCRQSKIEIQLVDTLAPQANRCAQENWGQILRELSAFSRYVTPQLRDAVRHELTEAQSLTELQIIFPKVDPLLLKVASFGLVHDGLAECPGLETEPFSSQLAFNAL
jgi:hypothetical protein